MKKMLFLAVFFLLLTGCGAETVTTKETALSTESLQLSNPWKSYDSLKEAEAACGLDFPLEETVADSYIAESFRVMNGELLEVTYRDDSFEITVRMQAGDNLDLSGVHMEFENTATYELDGGKLPEGVTSNVQTYTVEQPVSLMEAPAKDGYKFTGWKLTEILADYSNWDEDTFAAGQSFTGKYGFVTFVAQWEVVEYTITYELDDGALAEGESNPGTYTIETETFTLNNPTKAGYEFIGWAETADDESGSKSVAVEKGTTGTKTFYAIWKRSLVDLTISTSSTDANQSFIFTVSGERSDGEAFKPIEVVLVGSDSITIKDMPVGEYTVTEKDGWSWRQSTRGSQSADLRDEGKTVTFSFGVDRHYWLSGCSYYGRRKGGNG